MERAGRRGAGRLADARGAGANPPVNFSPHLAPFPREQSANGLGPEEAGRLAGALEKMTGLRELYLVSGDVGGEAWRRGWVDEVGAR